MVNFFISGEALCVIFVILLILLSALGVAVQQVFLVVMWIVMILQIAVAVGFLIYNFVVREHGCGVIISAISSGMALLIADYLIYDIYLTCSETGILGSLFFARIGFCRDCLASQRHNLGSRKSLR